MRKTVVLFTMMLFIFAAYGKSQVNLGFNGIGGKLGFILPEDPIDNTLGFGAVADLGKISVVNVYGYLDFWSKKYDEGSYWEWSWSVFSIAAIGKYYFETNSAFKPYAGAGLGFDISRWKSEYSGPDYGGYLNDLDTSDSELDLAIHLLGGASYEISPTLDGFAEVKYTVGGIDYLGIYAGVLYKLK